MAEENDNVIFEFSWTSILKVIVVFGVVALFFYISDLILLMFIVGLLSIALSPIVSDLKSRLHIPRIAAIALIYVVIGIILAITIYVIIPPVLEQLRNLYHMLPAYAQKISPVIKLMGENGNGTAQNIANAQNTAGVGENIAQTIIGFFGSILNFVFILVLTFLLLIEEGGIIKYFISLLPIDQKNYIIDVSKKINTKISSWFVGQLTIMVITSIVNSLFFWAVGVPYALTLGIIAFFFEAIPNIGPIIAAFPAMVLAYISAPWKAVAVFIFTVVFHLIGGQFMVPKIMSKAINTSPFIIILGLLVGGELAGMAGMVLALPVITTISVIVGEWPNIRKRMNGDI